MALAAALVTACSGTHAAPRSPNAAQVVSSLGAVPVPTGAPAESTPSAAPGKPALLAMGGPVRVRFADGATGLAAALGPDQQATGPARSTPASITLRLAMTQGSETVRAAELSARDDTGRAIALRPLGAVSMTVGAARTGTLRVRGTFDTGSAQLTWRHRGQVLAVWTFAIELD